MDIYTDGACRGNGKKGNIGCWGFIFIENGVIINFNSGIEKNTTNNKMELKAAIEAIRCAYKDGRHDINIYTDSMYVLNGITSWIKNWKKNNWKTSNKKEVLNQDLWKELDTLIEKGLVTFTKVKAHSTNKYNNMVDNLINKTMDRER